MNEVLHVAILGCGRVAGHHVLTINNHPGLKLAAICDLDEARMDALSGTEGVPRYVNYHYMFFRHPEIDVVAVITPSGMHFEHALESVRDYGKHVVIEKPVVMRISEGEILANAAQESAVHIFPVHQYRFNRCVQRIKQAVAGDELGDVFLATVRMRWCRPQRYYDLSPWRGTYALDGGCCTNQGIHHLDMLRFFAGEVKRVNAKMSTFGADIEVEDTAAVLLEFESGAIGIVEITTAARPDDYESSLSIAGSKGLAMLGGWATDKLVTFSPKPEEQELFSDTFEDAYGHGHNQIYAGVYDCIVNGGKAAVEFSDAMNTVKLLHAVYLSDERQDWVDVAAGEESSRLGKPDAELASLYQTKRDSEV